MSRGPENHAENPTETTPRIHRNHVVADAGRRSRPDRPGRRRPPARARPRPARRGTRPARRSRGPRLGPRRLFSRWAELIDPAAERLLAPTGWTAPDGDRYPTGDSGPTLYLQPLADALGDRVRLRRDRHRRRPPRPRPRRRLRARRAAVHRAPARSRRRRGPNPGPRRGRRVRHVVTTPSPLGSDGYPAAGEKAAADADRLPRPRPRRPRRRARYARQAHRRRRLRALRVHRPRRPGHLAETEPGTTAVWVLRRGVVGNIFGGGDADQLPARGALGPAPGRPSPPATSRSSPGSAPTPSSATERTPRRRRAAGRATLILVGEDGRRSRDLDEVIVLTGFRPDHTCHCRAAPRPRRAPRGPGRARPADRPQRPLLRHRLPARRRRALPRRAGRLPRSA